MYTQLGRVFDALTFSEIGTFPLDPAAGSKVVLTLDRDQQKAFVLVPGAVQVFDANTLAFSRSIAVANSSPDPIGTRMIRWGPNGLALMNYQPPFLENPGILLIDGTFVTP
jgi:hypothetical protein